MKKKVLIIAAILIVFALSAVFGRSGGGGGMLIGYQVSSYPFLESIPIATTRPYLVYYGGFGYGVNYDGAMAGGFGFAVMDVSGDSGVAGGFGGFISGYRLIEAPVNISFVSWTALGGISSGSYRTGGYGGYFAILQEITLEVGLPVLSWFMPTAYAGYQVAANLIPGLPFRSFLSYTPVMGIRIQWGSFR